MDINEPGYSICRKGNYLFVNCLEYINRDYILSIENEIANLVDFDKIGHRILDVCQCATDLNGEDLRLISQNVEMHLSGVETLKWAFIVDDLINHGQVRMFESIHSSGENDFQIFNPNNPDILIELRNWLGVSADFELPQFIEQHGNDI